MNKDMKSYMGKIGEIGGKAGTGKSKVRGTPEYYKELSKKAANKRREGKYYICPDKTCKDRCKHRTKHLFDPDNCTGEGTQCPACKPYRE